MGVLSWPCMGFGSSVRESESYAAIAIFCGNCSFLPLTVCGGMFLAFESKASIAAAGGGRVFPGLTCLFFSYLLRVFLCSAILYVC